MNIAVSTNIVNVKVQHNMINKGYTCATVTHMDMGGYRNWPQCVAGWIG